MPYYPPRYEQKPDPKRHKGKPTKWILLVLSVALIAYGGIRLGSYIAELKSSQKTTGELRAFAAGQAAENEQAVTTELSISEQKIGNTSAPEVTPPIETASPRPDQLPVIDYPNGYQLVQRIQKLRKKSKYIIGWITMDDLDEPVVHKDNTYFLTHDATGSHNSNGAIFMDEGTSLLTRPYTILLYGHNMKSGAMFGHLRKYETFSYYYKHRTFQFDTLYEEGQYAIFAVANVCLTPGRSHFVSLSGIQSSERETRQKALNDLIRNSVVETTLDVNEEDQILLLITCVGDDDERLIVAARRLREDEQINHLQMKKQSDGNH